MELKELIQKKKGGKDAYWVCPYCGQLVYVKAWMHTVDCEFCGAEWDGETLKPTKEGDPESE